VLHTPGMGYCIMLFNDNDLLSKTKDLYCVTVIVEEN
jgi:hypothetical protein